MYTVSQVGKFYALEVWCLKSCRETEVFIKQQANLNRGSKWFAIKVFIDHTYGCLNAKVITGCTLDLSKKNGNEGKEKSVHKVIIHKVILH